MTPERWARLRPGLAQLALKAAGENSARAESRVETAKILRPVVVDETRFSRSEIHKTEWQDDNGQLTLDVSMYGVLNTHWHTLESTGIRVIEQSIDGYDFAFNGERLRVLVTNGSLLVVDLGGQERARLFMPGLTVRSIHSASRRDQAYVFLLAQDSTWRIYRFDGSNLKMEHSFVGDESVHLHPFITSRDELYFVDGIQDHIWYRDSLTGRYEKIRSPIKIRRSHFWDENGENQATLIVDDSAGDLVAIDFQKKNFSVRSLPVSVMSFSWELVKFEAPDGKAYFVLGELDEAIRIIDAKSWQTVVSIPGSYVSKSLAVQILPEQRVLMSAVQNVGTRRVLRIYSLWNEVGKTP